MSLITIDYGSISGGVKIETGITPTVTDTWQLVNVGFKPTKLVLTGIFSSNYGGVYSADLINEQYIAKFVYHQSNGGGGCFSDFNMTTDDFCRPTENGFEIRKSVGYFGHGYTFDYVAIKE